MITILDDQLQAQAILEHYTNAAVIESINGEYTLQFTAIIDEDGKSEYITHNHFAEVEEQLFAIVKHRRTRDEDGSLIVAAYCQQVAYALSRVMLDEFIHAGTPSNLLMLLLNGTGFSVETVEKTEIISVDIREATTARAVLLQIAALTGGELLFNRYTISLLQRRGMARGNEFRFGKNLRGIVKDVDASDGVPVTAYEITVIELNSLPEFEGMEYFELGDSSYIVDEELGINEEQRIIRYEYDPKQRINSKLTIANAVPGLDNIILNMKRSTVAKDNLYYGTRIGPEIGFESIRSDKKARSVMNADKIAMQKGDGSGSNWIDVILMDSNGNAVYTGRVEASEFIGGIIKGAYITTGDNFPKTEVSNTQNHFRASLSQTQFVEMKSYENDSGSPVLNWRAGDNTVMAYISNGQQFLLTTLLDIAIGTARNVLIYGTSIDLQAAAGPVMVPSWSQLLNKSTDETLQQALNNLQASINGLFSYAVGLDNRIAALGG